MSNRFFTMDEDESAAVAHDTQARVNTNSASSNILFFMKVIFWIVIKKRTTSVYENLFSVKKKLVSQQGRWGQTTYPTQRKTVFCMLLNKTLSCGEATLS